MGGLRKSSGRRVPWWVNTEGVAIRRALRVLLPMHTSPKKIALGASVGLMIAFSPLIGFQMGLALVVATIFNVSRLMAVATVWVTNPLTMGMVYAFTYHVGRPFWLSSPDVAMSELSLAISGSHGPPGIRSFFYASRSMFSLGLEVWTPMLIGGLIIGAIAACLSYPVIRLLASRYQRVHRRRHRSFRKNLAQSSSFNSNPDTDGSAGLAVPSNRSGVDAPDRRRAA